MIDTTRRDFIATGAAAVAAATTAGRALAQSAPPAGAFFEKGAVRIRYVDTGGSGFPLLIIPGGGLNSTIQSLLTSHPFDPLEEFRSEFRCIACDLRTAYAGESTGPLEVDRPWDSFTDDHIGVMDHLGIDRFMVLGFCIG
jgi:pimeloyl-ACP methyl ester carboxylesterase